MEAALERKTSVRPTFNPIQEEGETLTYEIWQQHKREQQRLINPLQCYENTNS